MDYEKIPTEEAQQIQNIIELTRQQMMKRYPSPDKVLRGVHPKDHGCVLASFKIDTKLDELFRVGVFSNPGAEYPCAIRFSNAATTVLPDNPVDKSGKRSPGSRGMAVKLVNLDSPGKEGFLPVQDFLMVNHPVFAFSNVEDYEVLSKEVFKNHDHATMTEDASSFFAIQLPRTDAAGVRAARSLEIVTRIRGGTDKLPAFQDAPAHPAQNSYFSAAPFLFGDGHVNRVSVWRPSSKDRGVKYRHRNRGCLYGMFRLENAVS